MDEMQGVQVKLCYPLTIPKRLRDVFCRGAIQNDYLYLSLTSNNINNQISITLYGRNLRGSDFAARREDESGSADNQN